VVCFSSLRGEAKTPFRWCKAFFLEKFAFQCEPRAGGVRLSEASMMEEEREREI
jgi:hypothetical protein